MKSPGYMAKFGIARAQRMQDVGLKVLTTLAVVSFIADNASAAYKTATFDADTNDDFLQFLEHYQGIIETELEGQPITDDQLHLLCDSFVGFMESMDYNETVVNALSTTFRASIDSGSIRGGNP
jgi:hypothetical protein